MPCDPVPQGFAFGSVAMTLGRPYLSRVGGV